MSTNDTVILLANGARSERIVRDPACRQSLADFRATLFEVCEDLAQSIPADGEGATHLITVEVHGCRIAAGCAADRQDDRRQPAGENGHRRRRSELGPDRFGRRLRGRAVRPVEGDAASQRPVALRARRAGRFRRRRRFQVDRRRSRHEHRAASSKKATRRPGSGRPTSRPNTCGSMRIITRRLRRESRP